MDKRTKKWIFAIAACVAVWVAIIVGLHLHDQRHTSRRERIPAGFGLATPGAKTEEVIKAAQANHVEAEAIFNCAGAYACSTDEDGRRQCVCRGTAQPTEACDGRDNDPDGLVDSGFPIR